MLLKEVPEDIKVQGQKEEVKKDEKELLLSKKNRDENIVSGYLSERGIDETIINSCIKDEILYESMEHHNDVFIGKDENGKARYANLRGTLRDFKEEAYGSDNRYFVRLSAEKPTGSIHIFESAIDLLSYVTYMKCAGMEYRSENLISLAEVYQPKKDIEKRVKVVDMKGSNRILAW